MKPRTSVSPQRRLQAALSFLGAGLWLSGCSLDGGSAAPQAAMPGAGDGPALVCGAPASRIASLPRQRGQPPPEGSVELEGVVEGDFQGGLRGLFLVTPRGEDDADPGTPEGAFVALDKDRFDARAGQRLRVRGHWTAAEDGRGGWSLAAVEQIRDCGRGEAVPAVRLEAPPPSWAALEGMRVQLPGPLTITGNESLLRWGELQLSFGERLSAPTQLHAPGDPAGAAQHAQAAITVLVDDGRGSEWPQDLWHLPEPVTATARYRNGSRLWDLEGIVEYRHGAWRLQPLRALGRVEQAPQPATPARDRTLLRLASFNLLNFFNGDGQGGAFPTERGATSVAAMERQRAKLVAAMIALDADVLGLLEIENDGYGEHSAIADLAAALTAASGVDWHAARVDGDRLGRDVIAVGFLYRPDRVVPVAPATTLVEPPFDDTSRAPLFKSFRPVAGGTPFRIALNHFKSKGGCQDALDGDRDQNDGQACFNAARVASARLLAQRLAANGARLDDVLVMGDLNAYSQEDPVRVLLQAGLSDVLAGSGDASSAHSYVFRGMAGRLDHALAGAALAARVRAAGIWHINADELTGFAYDGDPDGRFGLFAADPYRSSDHDPVWVDIVP